MSARKAVPPLVLLVAVLAFYGRALDRPFTSEDFLLIRFLGEHPPWRDLAAQLTRPWLEISVVKFFRPVSTLLYGIEIALFGGRPFGYNLVHVLVHALNAVLVWIIVRGLAREGEDELTPLAAALLFAIYPLHPNAVIFSASFATIFGAMFFLGSIAAYQGFRERGSRLAWAASIVLFLLALGSYEAAAVLPGVIAAYDHLVGRRRLRAVAGYLPFFGVLGLYLLFRRWLFGVTIGGYDEYSQRLLAPQIRRMVEDLATSIYQLHFPFYDWPPSAWAIVATCAVFVAGPVLLWSLRKDGRQARLWLFAWCFALAGMAPFAFRPSVPGNGRYWYLAAAGIAMAACFAARGLRSMAPAVMVLLGAVWAFLLVGNVGAYIQAGRTARTIQNGLLRVQTGTETFLTRYPYFVESAVQVPVAQVYHYGVWDSVHPPFTRESVSVYPLPPLRGIEILPVLLGRPGSAVYEWEAGRLRRFMPPGPAPVEFQVLGPADGAVVDPARDVAEVVIPPGNDRDGARFRLILCTRINGAVFDLTPQGNVLRADLPDEILQTSDRLYGPGVHYWWIEARDASGRVSGFSRMRGFRVTYPGSRMPYPGG